MRTVTFFSGVMTIAISFILFAEASPRHDNAAAHVINADITTHLGDNKVFRNGDQVSFLISLDRDAYVLLLLEDAQRNLIQLYPYGVNANGGVFRNAGEYWEVPGKGATFRVQPPLGKESIWMFTAEQPFPPLDGRPNGPFVQLSHTLSAVKQRFRKHYQACGCAMGEAQYRLITLPEEKNMMNL